MKYQIQVIGYDAEADELDLLINSAQPQAAETIELDLGIYIRRSFVYGEIVGAFVRGYRGFAQQVQNGDWHAFPMAEQAGLRAVVQAIVTWQREVGQLSRDLAAHLKQWPPETQWLEAQAAANT